MSAADPALLEIKNTILRDPRIILEDRAVIQALIEANGAQGRNVVDLRGVLVDRLEDRLDRLEDTHRDVIAAAYENLAGTNQIHRAVLSILEPTTFNGFIEAYAAELPGILSIETVVLCLEGKDTRAGAPLGPVGELNQSVIGLPLNGAATYFGTNFAATGQRVMLREAPRTSTIIYGREDIGSEALIRLDFGPGTTPGLLAIGALDEKRFNPQQGIDLLAFLGEVFEKSMRRWLA